MRPHKPEEIVAKLRQIEIKVSQGDLLASAIHDIGVSEPTYHRWKKDCTPNVQKA
jgi:hypothetical protein